MNDLDRLCVLIYEFLFYEEARLQDAVETSFYLLRHHGYDTYYILKHYLNVCRLEEFNVFSMKISQILKNFNNR